MGRGVGGLEEAVLGMIPEPPAVTPASVRVVIAAAVGLVLLYWTAERALGEDADPSLTATSSSDTGSMVVLLSGTKAVMLLAAIVAVVLLAPVPGLPVLVANPALVLGALAMLVVAHWIFEKEEREA